MVISFSHVASSGPKYFHYTFSWTIALFLSCTFLWSKMWRGCDIKSPLGSTCSKNRPIRFLVSYTYFFNKEAWKHFELLHEQVKLIHTHWTFLGHYLHVGSWAYGLIYGLYIVFILSHGLMEWSMECVSSWFVTLYTWLMDYVGLCVLQNFGCDYVY